MQTARAWARACARAKVASGNGSKKRAWVFGWPGVEIYPCAEMLARFQLSY